MVSTSLGQRSALFEMLQNFGLKKHAMQHFEHHHTGFKMIRHQHHNLMRKKEQLHNAAIDKIY